MKTYWMMICLAAFAAGCATEEDATYGGMGAPAATQLTDQELRFIRDAAQSGLTEVQMGRLATQNTTNPSAQEFGRHLVEDHTMANQELMQIAARKGVTVPTTLSDTHQRQLSRLAERQGREFDEAFRSEAIKIHEKDIRLFENIAQQAQDPELRAFAQKTLPVLREHLQMAKSLNPGQ